LLNSVKEAIALTNYLTGMNPGERELKLFAEAIQLPGNELTSKQEIFWEKVCNKKLLIQMTDGALAITNPHSVLRKRIFIMAAILETSPVFANRFMPESFTLFHYVKLAWKIMISMLLAICGLFFLRINGINGRNS
jgi:hypothetical protein